MHALVIADYLDSPASPTLSPRKVAKRLSMEVGELAAFSGVHRNTLSARPQSPKVQGFLREVVQVIAAATQVFENEPQAVSWLMNEPLAAFRFKTAFQLVTDGRTDAVLDYLASIDSGFTG